MNGPLGSTWRRNTPVVDTIHIIPYLANILLIEPEQAYEPEVPVGARAGATARQPTIAMVCSTIVLLAPAEVLVELIEAEALVLLVARLAVPVTV